MKKLSKPPRKPPRRKPTYRPIWSIYTDGSVKGTTYGSAFVVYYEEELLYSVGYSVGSGQCLPHIPNEQGICNRCVLYTEVMAVYHALLWLVDEKLYNERIEIKCDNGNAVQHILGSGEHWPEMMLAREMMRGFPHLKLRYNSLDENMAHEPSREARHNPGVYIDCLWYVQ